MRHAFALLACALLTSAAPAAGPPPVRVPPRWELWGHLRPLDDVAFSADGSTLVTVCSGGVVKTWDLRTGKQRGRLFHSPYNATALAVAPKGRWLLLSSANWWHSPAPRGLSFRELPSGRELRALSDDVWRPQETVVSTDGRVAATVGRSGKDWWAEVRSCPHGRLLRGLKCDEGAMPLFSPDGAWLVLASRQGNFEGGLTDTEVTISAFRTATWKQHARLRLDRPPLTAEQKGSILVHEHPKLLRHAFFSRDSKRLFTVHDDGKLRAWDLAGKKLVSEAALGANRGLREWRRYYKWFDPRGELFVYLASYEGELRVCDLRTGKELRRVRPRFHWPDLNTTYKRVAFSEDGRWLATAIDGDWAVEVWDIKDLRPRPKAKPAKP